MILKSEFILSLCDQLVGGTLGPKQKSLIDRCTANVYRAYQKTNYTIAPPTLKDFREELLRQSEPEAPELALAIELFTDGSLSTFAKQTNVDDMLQSHTARTMLANSEFLVMLNQASTDRMELAKLLNISDLQLSHIDNVDVGHGLLKVGSALVPFSNQFPRNTQLYRLMTTKPGETLDM